MSDKKDFKNLYNSMSRRDLLKTAGTVSAAGMMGLLLPKISKGETTSLVPAGKSSKPNIVFILSDNCNADFMGFMGHPFIKTPTLDKLAQEGVVFDSAFCTTGLCSPSRGTPAP